MPPRAAFVPLEESKVVSSHPRMLNLKQLVRALIFFSLLTVFSAASVSLAFGQDDFTLTAPNQLNPSVVVPNGVATAILDLKPAVSGQDTPVTLACSVSSTQTTENLPTCVVSPDVATPPADGPSLTVMTASATAAGLYTITVTGTSGSFVHTVSLNLNVVPVTSDYTLSVTTTADPTSVTAGHQSQATVTVTPIGSYTGSITLSCLSITPVVLASPVCSFSPSPVKSADGNPGTAMLTMTTFGTANTVSKTWSPKMFYGLWLAVPGLLLVAGAAGKCRKNVLGMIGLMTIAGMLLLLPACNATSSTSSPTSPTGQITPKNTYTFTLTGVDQNGASPSNGTTTAVTVSLTVD